MSCEHAGNGFEIGELSQAGVAVLDCEHKTPPNAGEGHPYIAIPNLVEGRLDLSQARRITDEHLREWTRRARPEGGDVIVTRRGRVGDTAVVPEGLICAVGQNLVLLRADETRVDQRFLRWATRGAAWHHEVDRLRNVGAVFDSLNVRDIARLRIPVPPLTEQRRIAAVLGALDDKIDSNRQLAGALEALVLAEFQGRFGNFVGYDAQDEVPVGWRRVALGDVAGLLRDFVKGPSELPYIGLDVMPRGSTVLSEWTTTDASTGQAARFGVGDILFGKLRPYFKKVGVAPIGGRCSTEILVVRPRIDEHYGVVLGHLASDRFIEHCVAVSSGTRMPRAEWKDASTYVIALPPDDVAGEFTELTRRTYAHIRGLILEARTLSATRDAILPKLVSGEIRVPPNGDEGEPVELSA